MCNTKPMRIHMPTQSFVPCSFQFLERTNRLFTRERNDCIQYCFVFGQECNLSVDMSSIYLLRWERNDSYRSTFRITCLVVPSCGREWFYLKRSRLNAPLHHSTLRNSTERSGRSAFPFKVVISYIIKWHFQFL